MTGKTAIVTGGAGHLGRAISQALGEMGAHVVICPGLRSGQLDYRPQPDSGWRLEYLVGAFTRPGLPLGHIAPSGIGDFHVFLLRAIVWAILYLSVEAGPSPCPCPAGAGERDAPSSICYFFPSRRIHVLVNSTSGLLMFRYWSVSGLTRYRCTASMFSSIPRPGRSLG
jgi:hypothetical protein